jgi:transcriptional regulator with XRE-family HTH domain
VQTLLTQIRKSRGLSLDVVSKAVGTDPTNLSRVEKGTQVPKRDLARALFKFYDGVVPLGAVYDPEFARERALEDITAYAAKRAKKPAAKRKR